MDYDYKELLDEFCEYKKYSNASKKRVNALMPYIVESDFFNINNENIIRDVIINKIGAATYESIKNTLTILRSFTTWGIEVKEYPIKYFYEMEFLRPSNLLYYYSKTYMSLSITNTKLEEIIKKLHDSVSDDMGLYYEVLLRLYYTGITTNELITLRENDVLLSEKEIIVNGSHIKISDKTHNAITNYKSFSTVKKNNNAEVRNLFSDSFIKDAMTGKENEITNIKVFYQKRTSKIFAKISKILGYEITKEDVYNNGFLTFLEENFSIDEIVDLFVDKYPRGVGLNGVKSNNLRARMGILEKYSVEYRMGLSGQKVRRRIYPYVVSRYNV